MTKQNQRIPQELLNTSLRFLCCLSLLPTTMFYSVLYDFDVISATTFVTLFLVTALLYTIMNLTMDWMEVQAFDYK